MKRLSILGSTGSIGCSTIDVLRSCPGRFSVAALAAGRNVDLIERQVAELRPELVALGDPDAAAELQRRIGSAARVVAGLDGVVEVATFPGVDLVVSALVGAVGLRPTYEAVRLGRDVALANKEALVVAGGPITAASRESGGRLIPVDSEHNALHQCLRGERMDEVRRLWLTASGGPFRLLPAAELEHVTAREALRHPTWTMGPKVSLDSATLMNKGLEVIEARWLFDVGADGLRVVIHPQSVVHSMIELVDGSFKAQLGVTDMRHPIQYALSWPDRWSSTLPPFDPADVGRLDFDRPDLERFPCLGLAFEALEAGGSAPAVLNAANEVAGAAFLDGSIRFLEIPSVIRDTVERHAGGAAATVDELIAADRSSRQTAAELVARSVGR